MLLLLLLLLPLFWDGALSREWTLTVQPLVTVQEGMCAHIPCSFNFPKGYDGYAIYGSWIREGQIAGKGITVVTTDRSETVNEQDRGRFHLLGDPRKRNCSLSITDGQLTDTGKYFFRFIGYHSYSYTEHKLYINVTALIQKPNISIPDKLESGTPAILNCTFPWACGGDRSPTFSWKGAALSSQQEEHKASNSSELSFIPGYQHHGTNLTCQVTFPGGHLSTERTIQLNVAYAVQDITITITRDNRTTVFIPENSSSLVMQKGEHLHLSCTANSNPPAKLRWILGDQTLVSSQCSDDGELQLEKSHLSPDDGGKYTCLAEHPLGSQNVSLILSVPYRFTLSHEFRRGMIMGVLCGAGVSSLLALCLFLLLIKRLKKSMVLSTAGASQEGVEDPKKSSWVNQSLNSISPAADTVPISTVPEDELHYTYINFQGVKPREDHGSTDPLTEYSEIKFQ